MRPASAAFAAAIRQPHQLATLIEILDNGAVSGDPITAAVEGTVTLDATAQVRGRLALTIADDGTLGLIPTAATSALAPYGNEIRVSRGITYPDGSTELVSLGVYRIDDIDTKDTGGSLTATISGMDRAARIIDARFEEPYQVASGTNYATAIEDVLQAAWPDIPTDFITTTRTTPQLIAEEGADRWEFATSMATSLGMTLYFDGDGTCVLRPATTSSTGIELAEGEHGVLLEADRRWTRQGAFNRVIATGENTGEAAPVRGVATDDNPLSPTYYYGEFGKVPRFYSSPFITTADQAEDAAAAILARELGTTQQANFGTIVDPRLEPGDIVQVTRARLGIDELNEIDQLTIPLSAEGSMTGRTRATQVTS